jgi:hypothetical protein
MLTSADVREALTENDCTVATVVLVKLVNEVIVSTELETETLTFPPTVHLLVFKLVPKKSSKKSKVATPSLAELTTLVFP